MPNIYVVADSGSDLAKDTQDKYGVGIVPLSIQFGDDIYRDGVDMQVDEFYHRLTTGTVLPSTCQPSPADFVRLYKEIAEPGDSIISVHLSSKLSGTYQSAVLASTMVPEIDVTVLDTKSASMGIGLVAIAVAEAIKNGASKDEAIAVAENIIEKLGVYFVVDTLEYLQKNGRIGRAQAMVGSLLNIKPILTLQDGLVAPFEKVRGKNKALKRIRDLVADYTEKHPGPIRFGLTHADCLADAEKFRDRLLEEFPGSEVIIGPIGPTIGVHVGPGTIALLFHSLK